MRNLSNPNRSLGLACVLALISRTAIFFASFDKFLNAKKKNTHNVCSYSTFFLLLSTVKASMHGVAAFAKKTIYYVYN